MDREYLPNAKKNMNSSELFMHKSTRNTYIFIVISETRPATLSSFQYVIVPYDRRYPYCSGLAVHPSVVAAESKTLIFCIVAKRPLSHILIKRV